MADLIDETINKKLAELKIPNLKELDINMQSYLLKIEKVLTEFTNERIELIKRYKEKKFNISEICKETKISRATIYNHKEIIEKYIQYSIKIQETDDVFGKNEHLQSKVKDLQGEIFNLQIRDITIQQLTFEVDVLQSQIKEDVKTIEGLEKHRKALIDQIELYEKQIDKGGKLIPFKEKNQRE